MSGELMPPPWALDPSSHFGNILNTFANMIEANPSETVYGVSDDLQGVLSGDMLTIRHSDLRLSLPIIGEWPLRRLSISDIVATIRQISDACLGDEGHEEAILPYVTHAVTRALAEGTMPKEAVHREGRFTVEFCMVDEDAGPSLYVETTLGDRYDMVEVPVPNKDEIPHPPMPCALHFVDTGNNAHTAIAMMFSCTESDGIVCEDIEIDPMQVLRTARSIQPDDRP